MLGNTNITVLPNGCRIATSAMPGVESFSMCVDAGTGGRCERASELGFSHFLEHLLFKGSEKRPSTRAISQPVEERGGAVNAYTSTSHTCFYAQAPYDAAPLVADVLGDLYLAPVLAPREIDRERKVVLEEIKMYHDDDAAFASDLAQAALWPGHPLGRPILGTPASPTTARATRRAGRSSPPRASSSTNGSSSSSGRSRSGSPRGPRRGSSRRRGPGRGSASPSSGARRSRFRRC